MQQTHWQLSLCILCLHKKMWNLMSKINLQWPFRLNEKPCFMKWHVKSPFVAAYILPQITSASVYVQTFCRSICVIWFSCGLWYHFAPGWIIDVNKYFGKWYIYQHLPWETEAVLNFLLNMHYHSFELTTTKKIYCEIKNTLPNNGINNEQS